MSLADGYIFSTKMQIEDRNRLKQQVYTNSEPNSKPGKVKCRSSDSSLLFNVDVLNYLHYKKSDEQNINKRKSNRSFRIIEPEQSQPKSPIVRSVSTPNPNKNPFKILDLNFHSLQGLPTTLKSGLKQTLLIKYIANPVRQTSTSTLMYKEAELLKDLRYQLQSCLDNAIRFVLICEEGPILTELIKLGYWDWEIYIDKDHQLSSFRPGLRHKLDFKFRWSSRKEDLGNLGSIWALNKNDELIYQFHSSTTDPLPTFIDLYSSLGLDAKDFESL